MRGFFITVLVLAALGYGLYTFAAYYDRHHPNEDVPELCYGQPC